MPKSPLNPAFTLSGALALELSVPATTLTPLPRHQAGELARLMARDLAKVDAGVTGLEMSTVGAHYDPVEVLRPGWPLLHEIDQLSARAPGEDARIVAFGTHDGRLPGGLMPGQTHLGGPLRVLPFVLRGDPGAIKGVGETLERDLMEHGMAAADTALLAQEAFALKIEHARYLTLHDLCAMTALQYEHAGLAPLWPVIETALFSPERERWLNAPPEPLLGWCGDHVRMIEWDDPGWRQHYASDLDAAASTRLRQHFDARQRQLAAILGAHGMEVRMQPHSISITGLGTC